MIDRSVIRRACTIWTLALAIAWWLPQSVGDASQSSPCDGGSGWLVRVGEEDAGVGGTGVRDDEDGGVGGTGVRGDEDGGVGGTGIGAEREPDGGVGGTGIRIASDRISFFGRIEAFGSICINGSRVSLDESLRVEVDDQHTDREALAVGQVVALSALRLGNTVEARHAVIHYALSGPITATPGGSRIEVMGRPVESADAIVYDGVRGNAVSAADLRVGDYVRVSGLRTADGLLVASRLDRVSPRTFVSVTGRMQSSAAGHSVAGVRIAGHAGDTSAVAESAFAVASGIWNPESGAIEQASLRPSVDRIGEAGRLSLEGFVQARLPDGGWRVAGFEIREGSADLREFALDRLVRVAARIGDTGELSADRIELFERDRAPMDYEPRRSGVDRDARTTRLPGAGQEDPAESGGSEDFSFESESGAEVDESVEFEAPEHEAPELFETPETPEFEAPEGPEIPEVETPEFESPELPESEAPEIPEFEAPEIH
jgi:hypothetical protein